MVETTAASLIKLRHNNKMQIIEKILQMNATRDKNSVQRMSDITTK